MTTHTVISFLKSAVRIFGYAWLLVNIPTGVIILVISELIGIIEEVVVE